MAVPPSQAATAAFLTDPATYGGQPVSIIETHSAIIILTGARAYKMKKAVTFAYMDYGTLALREQMCAAEMSLNRRLAPDLYLGIRHVTRAADGHLAFDGPGDIQEPVIEMVRFPDGALLSQLAEQGKLEPALLRHFADDIARFHQRIEPAKAQFGGAQSVRELVASNNQEFTDCAGKPFDPADTERLRQEHLGILEDIGGLIDQRKAAGLVRLCHGDMHLGNVALINGLPVPFDGIEFSDAFASVDLLYDLAFLLMDLWRRGLKAEANLVLNRYLAVLPDGFKELQVQGLKALPLFLSLRAAVRAHVGARAGKAQEAQAFLDIAHDFLTPRPSRLVAMGGLQGTGKSSLARRIGPGLGPAPGAVILRTDEIRKGLFGVSPETKLPPEAYLIDINSKVYERLYALCDDALKAGYAVVADGVWARAEERVMLREVARRNNVPFTGLWLDAPMAILRERISARREDASDATVAVLERQAEMDLGPIDWKLVDARPAPDQMAIAVGKLLET